MHSRLSPRQSVNTLASHDMLEMLEPRLMLDGQAQAMQLFNASPALFVQNQGQWADSAIRYGFDGATCGVAFEDSKVNFVIYSQGDGQPSASLASTGFSVSFDGANIVSPAGQSPTETMFNYLRGDKSTWRSNVASYSVMSYAGLYDGIDLLAWGRRTGLKYEFDVAPGADYRQIKVHYDGTAGLSIDSAGALHIQTAVGDVVEDAPHIYQQIGGQQVDVAGRFTLIDANTYGFAVTGSYDATRPLILDPYLTWSTYLGFPLFNSYGDIAADSSGNTYITGTVIGSGLATPGAYQTVLRGTRDAFVAKLDPTGSHLLYFTYLGGDGDDSAGDIAVDAAGEASIYGSTSSTGLATPGAYQTTGDTFVAKLDATGSSLVYLTYFSYITSLAGDAAGHIYAVGFTDDIGLATPGAYQTTNAGDDDGYVARLGIDGTSLDYFTYLGGSSFEYMDGVAIDTVGNAYVSGSSSSLNMATPGAYQTTSTGSNDHFVAKINPTGAALSYLTYFPTYITDIAVDASGSLYIVGSTIKTGLATPGTYSQAHKDMYLAKLDPTASSLSFFTYFGSTDTVTGSASSVALDADGHVYITGNTHSGGLATAGAYDTSYNGWYDAFLARFDTNGTQLQYFTYLGAKYSDDFGEEMAVSPAGDVYLLWSTEVSGLATSGAYKKTYTGPIDVLVTKFAANLPPSGIYDLTATIGALPAGAISGSGAKITVPVVVRNEGPSTLPSSAKVDIAVYARTPDGMGGYTDTYLTTLTKQSLGTLVAGATKTVNASVALPLGLVGGTYNMVAVVDSSNTVVEQNAGGTAETNNTAVSAATISVVKGSPDLTAGFGTIKWPTVPVISGSSTSITVPVLTVNSGNIAVATTAPKTTIRVLARPTGGGADVLLKEVPNIAVKGLGVLRSVKTNVSVKLPIAMPAGTYELVAQVDVSGQVTEYNVGGTGETNNESIAAGVITVIEGRPDISVSLGTVTVPQVVLANTVIKGTVPVVLTNVGNVALPAGQKVNIDIIARDGVGGDHTICSKVGVPVSINPTKSKTINVAVNDVLGLATDVYSLRAVVTPTPDVTQWATANDSATWSCQIFSGAATADLLGTKLSYRAGTYTATQTFSMNFQLTNQGTAAAGAFQVSTYLSSDQTLDAGDVLLGSAAADVTGLAAKKGIKLTRTWAAMASGITPGAYYLITVIDSGSIIPEAFEGNNLVISPLPNIVVV